MGKPKPPTPPDPKDVASAQTGTNVGTAVANSVLGNVNQVTPYGSLTYDQTGTTDWTDPVSGETYQLPTYTATQTLSPGQDRLMRQGLRTQNILASTGTQVAGALRDHMSQGFSIDGARAGGNLAELTGQQPEFARAQGALQGLTRGYENDFSADRQRVEDALMGDLNQQLEYDRAAMEARLAQQGLEPGTEAYDRAMASHNDSVQQARTQALLSAGQEQSRLANLARDEAIFRNQAQAQGFGQFLQQTGFNNQTKQSDFQNATAMYDLRNQRRERDINEALLMRNQPLNEISALMSGSQVQQPNFMGLSGVQMPTVDYAGIVNNNFNQQMANYNTRMGAYNNFTGALGGLGAAFLM